MALDAQSNWNVEMAQTQLPIRKKPSPTDLYTPPPYFIDTPREILLPTEVISQILSYLHSNQATTQRTLYSCTLLSRAWYSAAIVPLYTNPHLHGGNYTQFITTVCPSKIARIRHSPLASLVRRLDMSELVHNSSKSLTARLLGRLKGNVEEFIAPQSSFAVNSFAALSHCVHLRTLDLRLISASISNKQLFQTLLPLQNLEILFFPRSSSLADQLAGDTSLYAWPPRLKALHLAGGINDYFLLHHLVNSPATLAHLSIQHCSQIHAPALLSTLQTIGGRLTNLTIRHPMTKLHPGALDHVLLLCPLLTTLRVSADYITNTLFELITPQHPLQILHLDCSPQAGADVGVSAAVICEAVDDGRLENLRSVGASARLAWDATPGTRRDVGELVEALEVGEMDKPLGVKAGVFVIKD